MKTSVARRAAAPDGPQQARTSGVSAAVQHRSAGGRPAAHKYLAPSPLRVAARPSHNTSRSNAWPGARGIAVRGSSVGSPAPVGVPQESTRTSRPPPLVATAMPRPSFAENVPSARASNRWDAAAMEAELAAFEQDMSSQEPPDRATSARLGGSLLTPRVSKSAKLKTPGLSAARGGMAGTERYTSPPTGEAPAEMLLGSGRMGSRFSRGPALSPRVPASLAAPPAANDVSPLAPTTATFSAPSMGAQRARAIDLSRGPPSAARAAEQSPFFQGAQTLPLADRARPVIDVRSVLGAAEAANSDPPRMTGGQELRGAAAAASEWDPYDNRNGQSATETPAVVTSVGVHRKGPEKRAQFPAVAPPAKRAAVEQQPARVTPQADFAQTQAETPPPLPAATERVVPTPQSSVVRNKRPRAPKTDPSRATAPVRRSLVGSFDAHPLLGEWADEHGCVRVGRHSVPCVDLSGRQPSEDGFDHTTLQLSRSVRDDLSPTMTQYWSVKANHLDKVIVMKVGSFYEMYDIDALLAAKELGLVIKGEGKLKHANAGVPEAQLDGLITAFVRGQQRKVGVVEQMAKGSAAADGSGKVAAVERELCSVVTPGTFVDVANLTDDAGLGSLADTVRSAVANSKESTLLAIVNGGEESQRSVGADRTVIGACILSAETHSFRVVEWVDDARFTHLRTLLATVQPLELHVCSTVSAKTHLALVKYAKVPLRNWTESRAFPAATATLQQVLTRGWFGARVRAPQKHSPAAMAAGKAVRLSKRSPLYTLARRGVGAGISALGGVLSYLEELNIAEGVCTDAAVELGWCGTDTPLNVSDAPATSAESATESKAASDGASPAEGPAAPTAAQPTFLERSQVPKASPLAPVVTAKQEVAIFADDGGSSGSASPSLAQAGQSPQKPRVLAKMEIDAPSIANLELLCNSSDGSRRGSLLEFVDRCHTRGGSRLIRSWLLHPLCSAIAIRDRQRAVGDLLRFNGGSVLGCIREFLARDIGGRDLENLLSATQRVTERITRARHAMYDETAGISRAVQLLQRATDCATRSIAVVSLPGVSALANSCDSVLLRRIVTVGGSDVVHDVIGGAFPDCGVFVEDLVKDLAACVKTQGSGRSATIEIRPHRGISPEFDEAMDALARAETAIEAYVAGQRRYFGVSGVKHKAWGRSKKLVLEVPRPATTTKRVPEDFTVVGQTKTIVRYATAGLDQLEPAVEEARARRDKAAAGVVLALLKRFTQCAPALRRVAACISTLDSLCCLAMVATSVAGTGSMCLPHLRDDSPSAMLDIRGGWHPCLSHTGSGGAVVPNDIRMGVGDDGPRLLLVTGPNMGGKSTLLRQTALTVILAQMGSYVPAESCTLTLADRIFTRVGASDRLLSGQSTFMVELEETSTILRCATPASLVIIDELGRGTSTFDGAALAGAVLRRLAHVTRCRTLFATHYHTLTVDFAHDPAVGAFRMLCHVNEDATIAFLYKFVPGVAESSFGLNVARLAGLPPHVVRHAAEVSAEFEDALHSGVVRSLMARIVGEVTRAGVAGAAAGGTAQDPLLELQSRAAALLRLQVVTRQ